MSTENYACSAPDDRPWITRLANRLFPSKHCLCPDPDKQVPGKGDVIAVHCMSEISFLDRLRVLVSGRVSCQSRVATENVVGNTKANSVLFPLPPKWMDRP